jgi:filamentous hemagglutinin family protein
LPFKVPLFKGDLGGSKLKLLYRTGLTILSGGIISLFPSLIALAQITPANDGTGTVVTPNGSRLDIYGGQKSGDGGNLFHSFQQFNLNRGQTANFLSTPEIQNILVRMGGDTSIIDGILQVTGGNSNLYLMNPAGIVFGQNASLNLPASLIATGASGIGFGNDRFSAVGTNDYPSLTGSPNALIFSEVPSGSVYNMGNLAVGERHNLLLVGNSSMNIGTLSAPGGNIWITPIPTESLVRIGQRGHLLSLEVEAIEARQISRASLPELLTGGDRQSATTLKVEGDRLELTGRKEPPPPIVVGNLVIPPPARPPLRRSPQSPPPPPPIQLSPNLPPNLIMAPPAQAPGGERFPGGSPPPPARVGNALVPPPLRGGDRLPPPPPLQIEPGRLSPPPPRRIDGGRNSSGLRQERGTNRMSRPPMPPPVSSNDMEAAIAPQLLDRAIAETTVKDMLGNIEAKTGQKPAVIYAIAYPETFIETIEGVELKSEGGLTLMLVPPEGPPVVKTIREVDERKLRRMVKEFRREVSDPKTSQWPAARQLYDWIIAPLEPYLEEADIDTLLFCLDEGLRSMPLAALHDGERFLIEKYNFSLIPSVSLTNASYEGVKDARVLALGISDFADPRQPDLLNVTAEVRSIEELWSGESLLNGDFTFENLKAARDRNSYQIIHLATHADFQSREDSYIQFWEGKVPLDRLRDLEWYKPPQVELLVLSACRTAVGGEREGDSELGFAGLAVRAGVKSALASLWNVSDVGTLGLMVEFYENLKSTPIKAEALRQAQLAMLRGEVQIEGALLLGSTRQLSLSSPYIPRAIGNDFSHPYFWAGFTMVGSPW